MTSASRFGLVGAASTAVRVLLGGSGDAPARGVVTHVGRRRVGIEVAGRLVVLAPRLDDGTLPCTVVVPGLDPARLGDPGAVLGLVRITRWWAPPRVSAGCLAQQQLPSDTAQFGEGAVDGETRSALWAAAEQLARHRPRAAIDVLCAIVGRGQGSTPDADDAIAGLLLAARALLPTDRAAGLEAAGADLVMRAAGRTTALSAELLRFAALGMAAPAAVAAAGRQDVDAFRRLLALGATSGRATAAGIEAARAAVRHARAQVRIGA